MSKKLARPRVRYDRRDQTLVIEIPAKVILEAGKPARLKAGKDGAPVGLLESAQQRKVFGFIRLGLTNKEIGSQLGISERTVKYHVSILLRKLRFQNRYEILRLYGIVKES